MPHKLADTRRHNVQALFQRFAEARVRAGEPPKGMEQAFAQALQMSPSMWSQIKGSRPIGDRLARQIESRAGQPAGWLDTPRETSLPTAAEQRFLALASLAWRAADAEERKRLRQWVKELAEAGSK